MNPVVEAYPRGAKESVIHAALAKRIREEPLKRDPPEKDLFFMSNSEPCS